MTEEITKQKQEIAEQKSAKQTLLKELSDKTKENIDLESQAQQSRDQVESLRREIERAKLERQKLASELQSINDSNTVMKLDVSFFFSISFSLFSTEF